MTAETASASIRQLASSCSGVVDQVGLRPGHDRPAHPELAVVRGELPAERGQVGGRIGGGQIHHHHERPASQDVPQEPVAQALALGGALDQAGDVRDHEPIAVPARHAEVRGQRGERVVRDLGLRGGQAGQERGLPGVRQPDETDVGDRPELHAQALLLAVLPRLGRARNAVARAGERGVAAAASAALARRRRASPRPPGRRSSPRSSETTVPSGTGTSRSLPVAPSRLALRPATPAGARWCGWSAIHDRSWTPRETSNTTDAAARRRSRRRDRRGACRARCASRRSRSHRGRPSRTRALRRRTSCASSLGGRSSAGGPRCADAGSRRPCGWSAWIADRWRTTSEARSSWSPMPSCSPRRTRGSSTGSRSPRCSGPSA